MFIDFWAKCHRFISSTKWWNIWFILWEFWILLRQISLGVRLFKWVLLLFWPNFPKGMFIPVDTFIPDSRIQGALSKQVSTTVFLVLSRNIYLDRPLPFWMFKSKINDTKYCNANGQPCGKSYIVHQLNNVGWSQVRQWHQCYHQHWWNWCHFVDLNHCQRLWHLSFSKNRKIKLFSS